MEKLVTERKEIEILRDDVKKREELVEKRELLLNERTELEAKKLRTSQVLNKVLPRYFDERFILSNVFDFRV